MTATNGHSPKTMTRQEMAVYVDEQARRYLKMTGAEFVATVERGGPLPEHPVVAHLLLLTGARVPAAD